MLKYWNHFIYTISFTIAVILFYLMLPVSTHTSFPTPFGLSRQFSTYNAGLSVAYFYLSLLISPFYHVFPAFPGRRTAISARKALGLMAFMFAAFHGLFITFTRPGGILSYMQHLDVSNSIGYWTGIIATGIFIVLAITSNDALHAQLGIMWKKIQQYAYLAGILVVAHVLFTTTHLENIQTLSAISFGLLSFLMVLESIRFEDYVRAKNPNFPPWVITCIASLGSIAILWWLFLVMPHPTA